MWGEIGRKAHSYQGFRAVQKVGKNIHLPDCLIYRQNKNAFFTLQKYFEYVKAMQTLLLLCGFLPRFPLPAHKMP
jgi:hypothetical protein